MRVYPEGKMKRELMQRYLRAFSGLTKNELEEYFAEVAKEMKEDFNKEVISKLRNHAEKGDYVMIVSGAFTPLLQAAVKEFHTLVDKIIGTEVPLQNGLLDVHTNIDHVQAERKTEQIYVCLKNKQIDWDNSYAYGDSYSDLPVLKIVGNPVAVCPDDKLKIVANKNKWEIIY